MQEFNFKDFKKKWYRAAKYVASPKCSWQDYIQYIFRDQDGKRVICPPHQLEIFEFIEDSFNAGHQKIAIEAPWGHGKTQSISLFYASRIIGQNPKLRAKICSANDSIATLRVGANKNTIAQNKDYKRVFPYIKAGDKWGESAFRVHGCQAETTDYTMQAGGVNSSVIGGRADLLIFDDPCDAGNSMTEDTRQKTISKIRTMWLSRLSPHGKVIWIGTPWHREDAMAVITKNWQRLKICVSEDVMCLEVYLNDVLVKQLPLWDAVWSRERLLAERKENYKTFNIGFRLIPASDEDATFKHLEQAIRWNTSPDDFEYVGYWGGVDLSTKSRPGTVGIVGGITPNRQRVVIDVFYIDDPVKIKSMLWDWRDRFGSKMHFVNVENNALQDAIVDILKGEHIIPIRGFHTGKNKSDPYIGLPVLDVSFENGSLIIPVEHPKDKECSCGKCRLIRALRLHPFASETDSPMALWFTERAMLNYGRQIMA